jgi:hypothetical protein
MTSPKASTYLKPVVLESFPDKLEPDTLYVSFEYGSANHLCACGCGLQTVTPLGEGHWSIMVEETQDDSEPLITLWPSILNRSCKSHYFVQKNKVVWT